MTRFTKGLPVVLVPEQGDVAFVRDDVVGDLGHAFAVFADRVLIEVCPTRLVPRRRVAALAWAAALAFGLSFVSLAAASNDELRAAWPATRLKG